MQYQLSQAADQPLNQSRWWTLLGPSIILSWSVRQTSCCWELRLNKWTTLKRPNWAWMYYAIVLVATREHCHSWMQGFGKRQAIALVKHRRRERRSWSKLFTLSFSTVVTIDACYIVICVSYLYEVRLLHNSTASLSRKWHQGKMYVPENNKLRVLRIV